jgi:hypothetical protein
MRGRQYCGASLCLRIFCRTSQHQVLDPRTIFCQMVRRLRRIRSVEPAWLLHRCFHSVSHMFLPIFFLAPGFLFNPLFFRTRPWLRSGFLPLAPAGAGVILYRSYLLWTIPSIRKIFPSLVVPVVPVLILARLARLRRIRLHCRLHWVSQRVAIRHTYHFCQICWHLPLQLLPQR